MFQPPEGLVLSVKEFHYGVFGPLPFGQTQLAPANASRAHDLDPQGVFLDDNRDVGLFVTVFHNNDLRLRVVGDSARLWLCILSSGSRHHACEKKQE